AADFATIAYSGAGVPLWTNQYNGPGNGTDRAVAVVVGRAGSVLVTGQSQGTSGYFDYATINYSATGQPLWTNRYHGPRNTNDFATALAVDGSGVVAVTGYSAGTNGYSEYATIAYSDGGMALWTNRYSGGADGDSKAQAVALDGRGNVVVTGYSF